MDSEVILELIKLIPSILWIAFVFVLVAIFYKPIRYELLPRLQGFKAFGVEASFIQVEIEKAVKERKIESAVGKRKIEVSGIAYSIVAKRAERLAPLLQGAQILWVDDNPDYIIYERRILRYLGIFVDLAETSAKGLSMLSQTKYDLVISDINREGAADEGLRFSTEMRKRGLHRRIIFYIADLDEEKGVPPYAFGITNRPDLLLHLVFDALEREHS